jgi:nitroreductase/ketosteroid isomerase-like protein
MNSVFSRGVGREKLPLGGAMKQMILSGTLAFWAVLSQAFPIEENRPGLTLRETFDLYVRSIQKSDLKSLFTTVTGKDDFLFLTSTGKIINTRADYYKFHEDWFQEKDWEMPVDNIDVREGKDFGTARAIFHYRSKSPEGSTEALDSWFTLVFQKEAGMWKVVADICTPIQRFSTEANPEIKYTSDQQYLFEIIKGRRTVRRFKPAPLPQEHILKILDAARFAPTSGNQQPWKFLVVQDRAKLDRLKEEACSWRLEKYKEKAKPSVQELLAAREKLKTVMEDVLSAPVYVAVLTDLQAQYPDDSVYDGSLAAGCLMIAARALGYGTGFFTTYFPENQMRKFFGIPDRYKLICFTPIGIPEDWPPAPAKKSLEEFVVFEKF